MFGGLTSSSGALTNGVTATTQSASDNSTKIATTAYTDTAIANLVSSAPSTLDTLNELAAALGDDPNFATTVTNSIATKLPLAGGTLTGDLTIDKNNPVITFSDNNNNPDYQVGNVNGVLRFQDTTNNATRFQINTDGHIDLNSNVDVTGNLVATGNEHKFTAGTSGDLKVILQADSDNDDETNSPHLLFRQDGTLDEGAIFLANNEFNIASTVVTAGGINFRTSTTNSGYLTAPVRMNITPSGQITMYGNVDCNSGLDVTGAINSTGNINLTSTGASKIINNNDGEGIVLAKKKLAKRKLVIVYKFKCVLIFFKIV